MTANHPFPDTPADRDAIRVQLERILASPLFANSKRYPALLRYVVEKTLDGHADDLKERTLGVDVFGRDADYDTNLDHVVRSSAAEVRKRLSSYYLEPRHHCEIRLDLLAGSYVPQFRPAPALEPVLLEPVEEPAAPPVGKARPVPGSRRIASAVIVVLACGLGSLFFFNRAATDRVAAPNTRTKGPLDRFWDAVPTGHSPVALCIGNGDSPQIAAQIQHKPPALLTLQNVHDMANQRVVFYDAITLSNLAGLLRGRNVNYEILFEPDATLARLRRGPVVTIGAFDNDWTIRLTGALRFNFVRQKTPDCSYISDRQNPSRKDWMTCWQTPYLDFTEDYALVSRVRDLTTEHTVVVAAGMTKFGTLAAGEFLTNPAYLSELNRLGPPDWQDKNLQAVLAVNVIKGSSGPPRLVAAHFW